MYEIRYSKTAKSDLKKMRSMSKATQKRLKDILRAIAENPYTDEYGAEDLKHEFSGYRSFELTKKDRVICTIADDELAVEIHQFLGHYNDK